jgi:glycosyltransferase involved in cell wall biosynthesis
MAYYENPGQLKRQYDLLRTMPEDIKQNVHVIVVDDCSPDNPAYKAKIGMPCTVFRINKKVMWNQDAARNIGAHHAATPWLLLTDMDHMVPKETWATLINGKYDPAQIYKFSRVSAPDNSPYHPHPNSWFMTKEMYQKVGGYDERFAGWYGTDADFRDRAAAFAKITMLSDVIVRVGREVVPDASTTGFPRKDQEGANEAIRRIKVERNAVPGWRPLNLTFPYDRVT